MDIDKLKKYGTKRNYAFLVLGLICTYVIVTGIVRRIPVDAERYFPGKTEGKVMKGYFRYGTFELSEKFSIVDTYSFDIHKEDARIDFTLKINHIKHKHLNSIMSGDTDEIKKYNYWVKKKRPKQFSINNKKSTLIKYLTKKSQVSDNSTKEITEICYIELEDKSVVKIAANSFVKYFENGRNIWESFYTSFKSDNSGPYKTHFGSFMIPEHMNDYSKIHYLLNGEWHKLTISMEYANDLDHERNRVNKDTEELWSLFSNKMKVNITRRTLSIDDKTCYYFEIDTQEPQKNAEKSLELYFIDDLSPGLRILIDADDVAIYEKNKNEIDHFIKSIKFFR